MNFKRGEIVVIVKERHGKLNTIDGNEAIFYSYTDIKNYKYYVKYKNMRILVHKIKRGI